MVSTSYESRNAAAYSVIKWQINVTERKTLFATPPDDATQYRRQVRDEQ
jgi:hypothetical protein